MDEEISFVEKRKSVDRELDYKKYCRRKARVVKSA